MTATITPPVPRTTYRSVFAVGQFRFLFAGMLMYVLGFGFEILGLSVLVYAQTHSAFATSLAFSMGFAPQVIGGALFTSLADRLPPRLVITSGLVVRAVPGLLIGLVPGVPIAAMLALVAAAAAVAPVFNAAISKMLPDVLDGDHYVLGRSVLSLTASGTQILSLGIGGGILALLSPRKLLLAAGCALLLSALIRLGLRPSPAPAYPPATTPARMGEPRRSGATGMRGTVRATMAGNLTLLADRRVRGLLLVQWLPGWFVTGAESLIVPYTESLGHPASAAAPLLAAMPAGMLLGEVLVGRFCRPAIRERLALPLALLLGVPLLALGLRVPLPAAGAVIFLSGTGFAYQLGIQRAFLDSLPPGMQGQGFGLNSTGGMSGQGLLPPVCGAIAVALGPAAAMAAAGTAVIVAVTALRRSLTGHVA
jgi:MFS family permease